MSFLHDSWLTSGNTFESFKEALKKIENATIVLTMAQREFRFCSVAEHAAPIDGMLPLHIFHKDNIYGMPANSAINLHKMAASDVPEDILQEVQKTKLLIQYRNSVFFTAGWLSRDLGARGGIGGEAFNIPSEARSRYLMDRYARQNKTVNAIVRKDNGVAKIVAIGSRTFAHVPQTILLNLLDGFSANLGKAECIEWAVTHQHTRIAVAFPEKQEDMVKTYGIKNMPMPAMLLETSDTGDSSIRCTAIWMHPRGDSFARAESYSRRHSFSTGRKDGKSLAELAEEEASKVVFKTYTKLPDRLAELLDVDVENPIYCIDQIAEHLHLEKALGVHRSEALVTALHDSICPTEKYTGFDLAMLFMGIAGCEFGENGICDPDSSVARSKLEELAYNAPFAPIEKWAVSSGKIAMLA